MGKLRLISGYSKEIVAAGASLFLLLVLVIVAVICCQRRRGRKQLQHIRRAASHSSSRAPIAGPLNATNNLNALSSEDTQLLRTSTISKLDANSNAQRTGDITAFPQNYHPARSPTAAMAEDIISQKQPFLSVPNHVSTYVAPPVIARIGADQQLSGRREMAMALSPDDVTDRSLSTSDSAGSILRRRQGSGLVSTVSSSSSTRVPLIKVMSAPEGGGNEVWEEQGDSGGVSDRSSYSDRQRPVQKRGNVDTSTVTWSYEPSSKPISYSPTPAHLHQYDSDRSRKSGSAEDSSGAGVAVEMVTFNTASKPAVATAIQRTPIKPQGILKSSSSLPTSGDQREVRSQSCVVVPDTSVGHPLGKKISIPAPPPQIPPQANASKPPPPSYSQALARLGRQKAVEFVDELPRRHDSSQQPQSALPPLLLSPPGGTAIGEDNEAEDRSPSPWHRLKPSVV